MFSTLKPLPLELGKCSLVRIRGCNPMPLISVKGFVLNLQFKFDE